MSPAASVSARCLASWGVARRHLTLPKAPVAHEPLLLAPQPHVSDTEAPIPRVMRRQSLGERSRCRSWTIADGALLLGITYITVVMRG